MTAVQSNTVLFDLQFTEFIVVICRKDKSDFLSVETPCNIISCLHVVVAAKLLLYCRLVLNAVLNSEREIVSFVFPNIMSDMGAYFEPATLMPYINHMFANEKKVNAVKSNRKNKVCCHNVWFQA